MRLWLDEMISAEVARQLRQRRYDVAAVQEAGHRWAWGLDDTQQLEAAVQQGRALVSYNLRDLVPLSQQWAEERRTHWGIVLIHSQTIAPSDIGGIVRHLANLLAAYADDDALRDRVLFLTTDRG
ncbi:MAG: DUF5615 family PIN-like protein [bacterium]